LYTPFPGCDRRDSGFLLLALLPSPDEQGMAAQIGVG
jgi:hypothetical protein